MKNGMLVLALLFFAAGCKAQDAEGLVKKVAEKLATVQDYEGQGMLKTDVAFMKVPDSKVTIFYKKPDKFKINKQNGISIVPRGGISINLNSLLSAGRFTAVSAGSASMSGLPVAVVKLLPLSESSDIVVSTLYIDPRLALVRKATTTTRDNGTYEMELSYGKYASWSLPDTVVFSFNTREYKLPKGLAFDYDTGEKPQDGASSKSQKGRLVISYSSYLINKGIPDALFEVKQH